MMQADDEMPPPQEAAKQQYGAAGTILEAAFVDPAYDWPPPDGFGKNAIELQASVNLIDDSDSVRTTESQKQRMSIPPKPSLEGTGKKSRWWNCCTSGGDEAILSLAEYEHAKRSALAARKEHYAEKKARAKAMRKKSRYNRVPEGILIYRLDTATQTISLMSEPHSKTDQSTMLTEMVIAAARPSPDKSRRGMILKGTDGSSVTLVACEQRTAIAWLEAIDLMLANKMRMGDKFSNSTKTGWNKKNLNSRELDQIEGQYLNLASYSNKLIRANKKSKKSGAAASGMYYSIEMSQDPQDDFEEEALESIAKRRAVIKDSWDFYRMICSLLRDRRKYNEVFRKLQLDPVYPYLHSMTGLNDPGDTGYENADKEVIQKDLDKYLTMTRTQVAEDLCKQAEQAMPSLVEICKALAGSLGMEEVGIGPVKEVQAALKKAEKKYDGDLLKITDFCRALLVVKDLPSLLALLELARDSFGPLIRRVKLSSLKSDHKPLPGGYRHCIINVELKNHICEIQVHLWPMWLVCGVDGFRHYRHCVEYNTDSFENAFDALEGLDRKTMAELIVMAEEAVAETPLDSLEWFQEKFILDYFAEVGLFMKHGLHVWAEITLRHLIRLRTESPDIGPDHHETILLYKYLEEVLRLTGKEREANEIKKRIKSNEKRLKSEKDDAEKSMWDMVMAAPTEALDMIMDPNKKEREEEEKMRKEVKASKKQWRMIRKERFGFLDANTGGGKDNSVGAGSVTTSGLEEKKMDDAPKALAL
ncbi:hypothetical protein IV203_016970 [Nitzschia inconspicua]|uniref:PH domain-containing protein n=1 Tax=Nitzschia inconspicua TaxID=303405 RepID=A0A9K3PI96_9STRA|nr:hypothetical protein IV203_017517 [Nitzschia inconspicua]KAG7348265.1 hypothetical protein IV203_016970 [Nitzschia inconspicua]